MANGIVKLTTFLFRSQSCNKDLWAQINAALQQTGKWHRAEPGVTWLTSLPHHPQPPPPPPPPTTTTLVLQHQHPCHPHPQSVVCVHGLAAVNKLAWDKISIPCIIEEPAVHQLPPPPPPPPPPHQHQMIAGLPGPSVWQESTDSRGTQGINTRDERDLSQV